MAARIGNLEEVMRIFQAHPEIIVNWKEEFELTALHIASAKYHPKVVSLLLSHPDIDVNLKSTGSKDTAFSLACATGATSCVRVLLKDFRVNLNEPNSEGSLPLRRAACGHINIIKWWIASGREMDLGGSGNPRTDAIGTAKGFRLTEIASLLERFRDDPQQTRHEVRVELRCYGEAAAEIFALVVFLCDELLEVRAEGPANTRRFFRIARVLPMDLQMVLCHRVVGSMGMGILGEERETAFRALAWIL